MRLLLLPLAAVALALAVWWVSSRHAKEAAEVTAESQLEPGPDARSPEGVDELSDAASTSRRRQVTVLDPVPLAGLPSSAHCRIVGRAVDDAGAPLAGAAVDVFVVGVDAQEPWSSSARTDNAGRFATDLPFVVTAEGSIKIAVKATGFHARAERTLPGADDATPRAWTAGDNDVGDLVLTRCGALRGRVSTQAGVLTDPVFIELYPVSNGRRTGAKTVRGEFRLSDLPPDSYEIGVRAAGWMTHTTEPVVVRFGETTTVPDIVLSPSPSIRGVVVDETGAGVSGLRIEGRAPAKGETACTTTRDGGAFTLLLLADEATTIQVRGTKIDFENDGGETIAAPGADDVRIVLKRLPRMHFLVVDENGAPVERFSIALSKSSPYNALSYDGHADRSVSHHPRGEWSTPLRGADTVVVMAPKCAPVKLVIVADAGRSDLQTIRMERGATIAGCVRLDGRPFQGSSIRLMSYTRGRQDGNVVQEDSLRTERTLLAGADGEFAFDELRAGAYVIDLSGPGASPLELPRIVVARGQVLDVGGVHMMRAAILRGVVLTRQGETPIHFKVKLDQREERDIATVDGRFEFRNLTVGSHTLEWSRPAATNALGQTSARTVTFELAPGEEREMVIDATPCSLTVRVVRNGTPVPGVIVRANSDMGAHAAFVATLDPTDESGIATAVLDPGGDPIRLTVLSSKQLVLGRSGRPLELVPGARLDETIHLETGTLVVVLPETLVPVSDGQVVVWFHGWEQPPSVACAVGSDPDCRIPWNSNTIDFGELGAGSYDVTIQFERWTSLELFQLLHEPHVCHFDIRNGAVTRIVVP